MPVLSPWRFAAAPGLFCGAWLLTVLLLHAYESRLLPSWHGFLHSAIANRFVNPSFPPENPFFAGETVPYYWFYQYCGFLISRISGTDTLHAFQWIALTSLGLVFLFSGLIGFHYFRSTKAGVLIGYLAIAGANPLGPIIAVAKHFVKGTTLWSPVSGSVETTFVTNQLADQLMTQPLLPALYISSDWRHGQNVVWFIDISSRAPALAILLGLLCVLLLLRYSWKRVTASIVLSALLFALSPIMGFAACAAMVFSSLIIQYVEDRSMIRRKTPYFLTLIFLAGMLLALPTYRHLFQIDVPSIRWTSSVSYFVLKAIATLSNYWLIGLLAIIAVWRRPDDGAPGLRMMTLAGIGLLFAVPFVILWPSNEHNMSNVSQVFLAVPAAGFLVSTPVKMHRRFVIVLLAFLPTTLCTILAYTNRPPLPLSYHSGQMVRMPEDSAVQGMYDWIQSQTDPRSVFICDPERPIKLSGNVSELPALTGRTLFTDIDSYLVSPNKDTDLRAAISAKSIQGVALEQHEQDYLSELRRPVYLVTYHAMDPAIVSRLTTLYGDSVFHRDFLAVFRVRSGP